MSAVLSKSNGLFTLNICSWNIEGLAKYENNIKFERFCMSYDIVGFCETWGYAADQFSDILTGFTRFDYMRTKKSSALRGSGGISVFVNKQLIECNIIKRIFHNFEECVVLYLDLKGLNIDRDDIVFVFVYISPEYSPIYHDRNENGIEVLSDQLSVIVSEFPEAKLFLAGDFNARMKDFQDFISHDDVSFVIGENSNYPADDFSLMRDSKDQVYNRFGLSLIELCCSYNVHTLNGRMFGDSEGNFTCTANNGTSVVDYMICSSEIFDCVTDFRILTDDLSVHFPLKCSLSFMLKQNSLYTPNTVKDNVQLYIWTKYKWNEQFKDNFLRKFRNNFEIFQEKMTVESQLSATSLLSDCISVLRNFATSMLCCNNIDRIKTNPGWWNNECKVAEHNKVLSLRKFRLTNSYADLLEYKARKKKFKSICKYKKISYQRKRKNGPY